ncbi:carboxynorspermidine decarboxylase [Muribaculaceae bacterium Isolate-039 (Harlan)]|jgi:carboxynorspermidine decarboxylase|uniref:carboxynorspermidine decarboxylase n=1 Tax=Duncaniella muris TaxID=2094150 RepID=UPI000F478B65|nr:carboxynorspermidine decarboxylase [Duncaniella muris]ROS91219.1 carboxynorspermidine decarboxylase [Muribaculaceae bacterium Isolate-039 (Harlan)]ROS94793.1 carboxynorspermidine decarboxylase [Muribaculaceae bacterium Isolate-077 (Janvier)]ROS97861.1 carboxynorspermidine decarboxylase [Muribaculaceae bacterium Isolate-084 (Janvier)]ROS98325.1 carboxynorspermidine decarboxylase [Muribaculaceae bacterium Isolate-083 (Janvier)]
MKADEIATPYYIVYEDKLRRNLSLINRVEREAGVNIIMAFKAYALWRTFPIIREYNRDFTASSLNELRLGNEELGGEAHVYCPVYTEATISEFLSRATHLTFNSLGQWEKYGAKTLAAGVSPGLRVNPQCSVIETEIYNPALPGSRFGVTADQLAGVLPAGIEGLHFHALCESSSYDLEKVLAAFEDQFGMYFSQLKWVNFGGGHLMTREGYDVDHLIGLLKDFRGRYPWLQVVMEPGSAFTWRTGDLITEVLDVVENQGVKTAVIDASFACHMPDCLEMPYKPAITESVPEAEGLPRYRLGGNSCLSGDYVGDWCFREPLKAGDRLTLEDMNHYTTVKTTMFNGIQHPAMVLCDSDGNCTYLRRFDYNDYKNRMN